MTLRITRKDGTKVKLDFRCPELTRRPDNFKGTEFFPDPLASKSWKISAVSALGQVWANCGDPKRVEMHHIKHLKTLNARLDSFSKMMASINRKQIPLCRPCHVRVHNGTGMSLKHFEYIK